MSADPAGRYEIIHFAGLETALVPLPDLRVLKALERAASPELLEHAKSEAANPEHDHEFAVDARVIMPDGTIQPRPRALDREAAPGAEQPRA